MVVSMLIFMPTISFSKVKTDSVLLNKVWNYRRNFAHKIEGGSLNSYMRYTVETNRRNFTMFLVPTLYSIAQGDRKNISEMYGTMVKQGEHEFPFHPQIISNTIQSNRQISDAFTEYLTPNIYDITIYDEKILSPFHRFNRIYYRYTVEQDGTNLSKISFRPKLKNTQLVKGYAIVETNTGRVIYATFEGEFNMVDFHVDLVQGTEDGTSMLPQRCMTDITFKFMGNRITSHFLANFNNQTTLPDSLHYVENREMMDSLRPIQLRDFEKEIYNEYDERKRKEKLEAEAHKDTTIVRKRTFEDFLIDFGDKLVTSSHTHAGGASLSLSPILNPQYVSYTKSKGLSYKIQFGLRYNWNAKRYLTIEPQIGYNFGIKQFYHYTPIRMTYNPKRRGYAEIVVANGNRISNASVIEVIRERYGNDSAQVYQDKGLDYFDDNYFKVINNVVAYDWLEVKAGIVYHIRKAKNEEGMKQYKQPITYRSFAPSFTIHVSPWRRGPYFTLNYERSFKGILGSTLEYERYEFDASHKFKLNGLRRINLKGGFGLYTNQMTSYFLDYANFRDENLPGGWEDEWTGNFQLLNSQWYNMSNYYLRINSSYESPLLLCSFLPFVGKHIEKERIYLSLLSIQHTRPYSEIGYSISTRFVSIGIFASFLNLEYKNLGTKFTFELFRKW